MNGLRLIWEVTDTARSMPQRSGDLIFPLRDHFSSQCSFGESSLPSACVISVSRSQKLSHVLSIKKSLVKCFLSQNYSSPPSERSDNPRFRSHTDQLIDLDCVITLSIYPGISLLSRNFNSRFMLNCLFFSRIPRDPTKTAESKTLHPPIRTYDMNSSDCHWGGLTNRLCFQSFCAVWVRSREGHMLLPIQVDHFSSEIFRAWWPVSRCHALPWRIEPGLYLELNTSVSYRSVVEDKLHDIFR
jgi:hypothetical protein